MDAPTLDPEPALLRGRTSAHWVLLGSALFIAIGFVVLGRFISPDERGFGTHERLGMPPCRMLQWSGVPCPGCGVTTSVSLAANGRFLDSIANQPFGFVCALLALAFCAWAFWNAAHRRDLGLVARTMRMRPWVRPLIVIATLSWIYKIVRTLS